MKIKNTGIDKIHANVLKTWIDYIESLVLNLSIPTSICPEHFKITENLTVYKSSE